MAITRLVNISSQTKRVPSDRFTLLSSAKNSRGFLEIRNTQAAGGSDVNITFFSNPWSLYLNGGDVISVNGLATDLTLMQAKRGQIEIEINYTGKASLQALFSIGDSGMANYLIFYITSHGKLAADWCTAVDGMKWSLVTDDAIEKDKWLRVSLLHDGITPWVEIDSIKQDITFSVITDKTAWFAALPKALIDRARVGIATNNANGFRGQMRKFIISNGFKGTKEKVTEFLMDEGSGDTLDDNIGSNDGSFSVPGSKPQWDVMESGFLIPANSAYAWESAIPTCNIWVTTGGHNVEVTISEGIEEGN